MKLGHRGEARAQHFAIGLARDRRQRVGADAPRQLVHAFPPGPEIIAARGRPLLGVARQSTLECVAVGIAQAGNQAPELLLGATGANLDRRNPPVLDVEADMVAPAVGQQRFARENRCHAGVL